MTTLVEREVAAMLAFVSELKDLDDPLPFPPRLLQQLHTLISSDCVDYGELDPLDRRSIIQIGVSADGEHDLRVAEEDSDPNGIDLFFRVLRPSHPVCGHRITSGDWTTPFKVSDFATLREFERTAFYDYYREDFNRWLDVGLPATPTLTRVFRFTKLGTDFDEHDRLVLKLLRPYLEDRYEAAETASRAAVALAAVEEDANGDEARRVVLCSGRGVIEFASQSSRALLERYLGVANGCVPEGVLHQQELAVVQNDRRLTVRIARVGALHVLLLGENDLRLGKLTRREREILDLVALGRENDEIAFELEVAPATVAKHLEHVYEKLDVRNRTAAAALLDID
jgi:DNA-binding CsgD family transcriptional regulator